MTARDSALGAVDGAFSLRILDTAPDAMLLVDDAGRIVFVNAQTERLFGFARDELVGQSLDALIPARFRHAHSGHVARYMHKPTLRSMGSGLDLFGVRKDGSEIAIEVSLSPVETSHGTYVSAAIRDISERKRILAAAQTSADRLASAVESIQDAFALFDKDDHLVLCNSVYRRLIGDAITGPLVGKPYVQLLDAWMNDIAFEDGAAQARFRTSRLTERKHEPTSSFDLRLLDGRHLRVIDRRTAEGGIVKMIWDLTDDVERAEELRVARTLAEAASNAKSEFLSSMSHELRTPLNAILGFAQLLQRDKKEPLSERHRERVSHILKGGEHLLRLIDDILDLARIEAGRIAVSCEPVQVASVLDEVRTTLLAAAARLGVLVHVEPVPSDLPAVFADRTRLMQVLTNLGSNAIKYNRPEGSVHLTTTLPSPGFVRITVADTGVGIPTEKQGLLFMPFQRAGQENGPIEGTGIGLVITRRLAELMNGRVDFRSEPGRGSEFWIDVPVHVPAEPPSADLVPHKPDLADLGGHGPKRVLYVEDNPANVVFMRDVVSDIDDLELLTEKNAEDALAVLRTTPVDVVIMDINLPGMSGLEALHVMRQTPALAHIPVIALTAAASDRDRERGLQAGFARYLTKPVKVDEFFTALQSLLQSSHTRP